MSRGWRVSPATRKVNVDTKCRKERGKKEKGKKEPLIVVRIRPWLAKGKGKEKGGRFGAAHRRPCEAGSPSRTRKEKNLVPTFGL